jgi:predicted RNase H-like HicB family nuclease
MKQYAVIYEKGETNWGAIVPDLPGCVSIGDTLEELEERGEKIPEPLTKVGLVDIVA